MQLGSNPGRSCDKQTLHFIALIFFSTPRISSTIFFNDGVVRIIIYILEWPQLEIFIVSGSFFSPFTQLAKTFGCMTRGSNPCPPCDQRVSIPSHLSGVPSEILWKHGCGTSEETSQLLFLSRVHSINWRLSIMLLWLLYMTQGSRPALFELACQHH